MRKSLVTLSVLAALPFVSAAPAMAQGSPHSVSANVGFVSDYAYRGISQTNENMAIQGGFDYAHASGLYAGVWGSSIDWLDKGGVEADVYGGYKAEMGDFGYDVGVLHYAYPGGEIGGESPDTTEVYLGASWKFVSFSSRMPSPTCSARPTRTAASTTSWALPTMSARVSPPRPTSAVRRSSTAPPTTTGRSASARNTQASASASPISTPTSTTATTTSTSASSSRSANPSNQHGAGEPSGAPCPGRGTQHEIRSSSHQALQA